MTAPAAAPPACPLCAADGGHVLVRTPRWRLVRADEAGFPAFYRVIWNAHVAELSDLTRAERAECLDAVVAVEDALRRHLRPDKVNLASLGNMVPHLHWHVIARFAWDSHFPAPVWASPRQPAPAGRLAELESLLPDLEHELIGNLSHSPQNP